MRGIRISDYVKYSFLISYRESTENSLCHALNLHDSKGTDADKSKDTPGSNSETHLKLTISYVTSRNELQTHG
jgi:hypothetical protein